MSSGSLIDLRKGASRGQKPLFSLRPAREPESPRRPASLRTRRRKTRIIIALLVLLVCAGVAYGISWASYLPQLSINSISITGAKQVPEQLIRHQVETILDDGSRHILSRANIFIYPREVIERAIEGFFPRIRSAHISREPFLSTAITIAVEERAPFAAWCPPSARVDEGLQVQCYSMDNEGFIFAERGGDTLDEPLSTHYTFRGGVASSTNPIGQKFVPGHLPGLVALLQLLGQAGFDPQGSKIDNAQDFLVPFAEGFTLKASFGQNANMLTKNLELVLSSDALRGKEASIEYIDLRFDNRVYYKLEGEDQTQPDPTQ